MSLSAPTLIEEASRRGVRLTVAGERLRVEAPAGTLTPELRAALAAHKADILRRLRENSTVQPPSSVDTLLGMPLAEFGRRHVALRVKLPDGSMCWFCSGPNEVAVLRGDGVERRMIWTVRELADVLGAGWTRETIAQVIAVKRLFEGTVGTDHTEQNP